MTYNALEFVTGACEQQYNKTMQDRMNPHADDDDYDAEFDEFSAGVERKMIEDAVEDIGETLSVSKNKKKKKQKKQEDEDDISDMDEDDILSEADGVEEDESSSADENDLSDVNSIDSVMEDQNQEEAVPIVVANLVPKTAIKTKSKNQKQKEPVTPKKAVMKEYDEEQKPDSIVRISWTLPLAERKPRPDELREGNYGIILPGDPIDDLPSGKTLNSMRKNYTGKTNLITWIWFNMCEKVVDNCDVDPEKLPPMVRKGCNVFRTKSGKILPMPKECENEICRNLKISRTTTDLPTKWVKHTETAHLVEVPVYTAHLWSIRDKKKKNREKAAAVVAKDAKTTKQEKKKKNRKDRSDDNESEENHSDDPDEKPTSGRGSRGGRGGGRGSRGGRGWSRGGGATTATSARGRAAKPPPVEEPAPSSRGRGRKTASSFSAIPKGEIVTVVDCETEIPSSDTFVEKSASVSRKRKTPESSIEPEKSLLSTPSQKKQKAEPVGKRKRVVAGTPFVQALAKVAKQLPEQQFGGIFKIVEDELQEHGNDWMKYIGLKRLGLFTQYAGALFQYEEETCAELNEESLDSVLSFVSNFNEWMSLTKSKPDIFNSTKSVIPLPDGVSVRQCLLWDAIKTLFDSMEKKNLELPIESSIFKDIHVPEKGNVLTEMTKIFDANDILIEKFYMDENWIMSMFMYMFTFE